MNFAKISDEMSSDKVKEIVDSILGMGKLVRVVIDRQTFEIIYESDRAIELFGSCIGKSCHEAFCTAEIPCIDCPMNSIGDGAITNERYSDRLERSVKWNYSRISWFDNREVVLATLVEDAFLLRENSGESVQPAAVERRVLDPLTRIPNYSRFYQDVDFMLKKSHDKSFALVVFDIERFKSINDKYGMAMGDEVLKHIGASLKNLFGNDAFYTRMHSDVFAFCIEYEKKGDIIKVIEKLRKRIGRFSQDIEIITSYGIYLITDREVPVNLMYDRAMMAAKTIKGNLFKFCSFYDEQYRIEMLRASEIEGRMASALANGEFRMYLQPKYNLLTNELCGAEVLSRWYHPERGIVPPDEFIPLFEKNGFILKLDEYMWEQACKTIRMWIDEGKKQIPLSINISRYHIKHSRLENVLLSLLKKYNLSTDALTLEITESLFLDNPTQLNRVLDRLHNLGFSLEVDDFGSGFSSLNLIRNISVDTIKIDKAFLDSEIASEKGKIVVNHTIGMAKDLKLQVVAEGVETMEHVEFLKQSNCDIAQGYFFAKPMPVDEFDKMYQL